MQLRPYQSRSVDFLLPRQRAFIIAPAGSGKTIIAAKAASLYSEAFGVVVWLCNTREQCEQARAAIAGMVWADPVSVEVFCVAARPDISGADLVIIDEAHHLPAATWWATAQKAGAVVWGFSATPWSDPERDAALIQFFGNENFLLIDRQEVQAGGSITAGQVIIHDLDTPGQFDESIAEKTGTETERRCRQFRFIPREEHAKRARWQFTAEAVRTNYGRNARIIRLGNGSESSTLILVSSIEHGKELQAEISDSVLVYAAIGKKKRAAAIADFRSGKLRVMIATSLADEGLDVPRASVLILAAGGRSAGKLEQRAGRVMRPFEGKEFGTVHDFADRGATLAHAQFLARARTYKKLGYTTQ